MKAGIPEVIGEDEPVKRTTIIGLVAVPVVIGGLYLLMLNGFLTLAAVLLAVAVVGMLGTAVWDVRRGHRKGAALLTAGALVTAAAVGWYAWNLNDKLGDITRVDDGVLAEGERPEKEPTEALNILLMGADNPTRLVEKPTIAELLATGEWDAGAYRSDTVMVMHVPADRSAAYVVSVPRDSLVTIYDDTGNPHGQNKVNDAFSAYGPFGTWRTIENLSGLRLDHMAIIDYARIQGPHQRDRRRRRVRPRVRLRLPAGPAVGPGLGAPGGRAGSEVRPDAVRPPQR